MNWKIMYKPKRGEPIYTTNIANQVIEVGFKGIESPKFIPKPRKIKLSQIIRGYEN